MDVECVVDRRSSDERDGASLCRAQLAGRVVDLRRHVHEDGATTEVRTLRGQADRRGPAERHTDDTTGGGRYRLQERGHRLGVLPGSVVAVVAPVGAPVPGQVDGHGRAAQGEHDGVPRVRVLRPAVQEDELRFARTPTQVGERLSRGQGEGFSGDDRLSRERDVPFGCVLAEQRELVVLVRIQCVPQRGHGAGSGSVATPAR
jgi:hypothetical protein